MKRSLENGIINLFVPKSLKPGDNRVAVPPEGIVALTYSQWNNGLNRTELQVLVEDGAGVRSGWNNGEYKTAGARIVSLEEGLEEAHVLVDVKQRPQDGVLAGGINIFYMHVEKGQGPEQLRALLEAGGVTAYSPETFWVPQVGTGKLLRGTNLGYWSGVGGAHILMEGVKLSHQLRGVSLVPFEFFPQVDGASAEDITNAYRSIGDLERSMKFAVIGGKSGLVANGAMDELRRAGLNYDLLYRDVTCDSHKLAKAIGKYDAIINATTWNPGGPRLITREMIQAMKPGAVLMDNTCDQDGSTNGQSEGEPVIGGVRHSYESKWGDPNTYYWVGPDRHTFNDQKPLELVEGTHVLYNVIGMVPGGTSTARAASQAYFGMIFPYLSTIIRAVAQGTELPENGMVVKDGLIHDKDLVKLVQDFKDKRTDLHEFREYLPAA